MHECFITYRDNTYTRLSVPDDTTLEQLIEAAKDGELTGYQFRHEHVGHVKVVVRGADIRTITTVERGTILHLPDRT